MAVETDAQTSAISEPAPVITRRGPAALRALRSKQWTKNLIVFVGAVFALRLGDPAAILASFAAFLCFCLMSSAGYVVNDVCDVEADRQHPQKRLRPIASGELRRGPASLLAGGLIVLSLLLAASISLKLMVILVAYLALTVAYSAYIKHLVLLDLFAIAGGFVLRVVGGAVAVSVPVSAWLYICTILAALFLGLAKRRQELISLERRAESHRRNLSEYTVELVDQLTIIVVASTIMAYSLYTFSAPNLPRGEAMMTTVPVVIYGLFRYLFLVRVKGQGGSPEELLFTDRPLLIAVLSWGALCVGVLYVVR
jgi:4-hydroxybenzoate polyprenyltransferase